MRTLYYSNHELDLVAQMATRDNPASREARENDRLRLEVRQLTDGKTLNSGVPYSTWQTLRKIAARH